VLAVSALATFTLILSAAFAQIEPYKATFVGEVRGDPKSDVFAKVRAKPRKRPRIYLESDFRESCVDGMTVRASGVVEGRFFSGEQFHIIDRGTDLDTGHYHEFEIEGRLIDGEVLRGKLRNIDDYYDPPGEEGSPECATQGRLRWRAELDAGERDLSGAVTPPPTTAD
jgi:hypothetical protein